jgi:predicted dehydrogenase
VTARLGVAVVGTGRLGSIHARVLSQMPNVELVGVVDSDLSAARRVAAERGCRAFADANALPETVKAVVVAVPTTLHADVACPLLERGIACLVEKPLAANAAEGERLVAAAARSGAILMVGHVERFNPVITAVRELGLRPRFLDATRVSPFPFRSMDIGVVLDVMIHDLDIVLHLVGSDVVSVDAVGVNITGDHEDLASVRLVFANGAVANLTASRLALKTERKLRLFAPDFYASLDLAAKKGRIVRPSPDIRSRIREFSPIGVDAIDAMRLSKAVTEDAVVVRDVEPLRAEDEEFVAAVSLGRSPLVTGAHGLAAMEVASRVVASIQERLAAARRPESSA